MSNLELKKTYGLIANPLNKRLVKDLEEKGEEVLIFPAVQPKKLELTKRAAELLENPAQFNWLILTDVFAADFFIQALHELKTELFELDDLTVCAMGEAVADRLRFVQVHADVIPPSATSEAVFSAISQFATGELAETRLLVLREKSQAFGFIEMLKNAGAAVEELELYEAEFENDLETVRRKALLKGGALDEFVFSSPEDVWALKLLFGENELSEVLKEIKLSATSEIVFQTLQENQLRPLYFHHQ